MASTTTIEKKVSVKGSVSMAQDEPETPSKEPLLYSRSGKFTPDLTTYGIKLGWIQGVLIPCLLNIWGVMLFLRIAWVVAQAGTGLTIVIIGVSSTVCVITALSLSAICANGKLKGGGVYYIVSRSLGAEFGASVGIIFAFANAVAASMNTIGFCESLNDLLKNYNLKIIDNGVNDIRIVGAVALFVMCVICAIGMDWETRTQNFLITIIVVAITNYIIGACVGPLKEHEKAQGFVGINSVTAAKNWVSDFRSTDGKDHDFFSVFAIYFPAVTGVQAGANICGDLKDPAKAIPKGTLVALLISGLSYLTMAVLCGLAALRDASGNYNDFVEGTISNCAPNCTYGLHNSYEIMNLMALWGPLIYGGCWAATLSTALTNLLSVPRLVQALGTDRIYPGFIFFSKPYGRHGEPYRGYVLVFTVSLLFLLIADLNRIAPLITNFYLASYALINFCTFHASFVRHISWRPTFKYYNTWLSLLGFALCVVIMIIISWIMALITVFLFFALYLIVQYRDPDVNWGGSTEAQQYMQTVNQVLHMSKKEESIKMYCPQPLVLTGEPFKQFQLLDIADDITDLGSFMIVANIKQEKLDRPTKIMETRLGEAYLSSRNCRGFYVLIDNISFNDGVQSLIKVAGLGRLTPNTLLLGFKNDWKQVTPEERNNYYEVIRMGFEEELSVCVYRKDLTKEIPNEEKDKIKKLKEKVSQPPVSISQNLMHTDSEEEFEELGKIAQGAAVPPAKNLQRKNDFNRKHNIVPRNKTIPNRPISKNVVHNRPIGKNVVPNKPVRNNVVPNRSIREKVVPNKPIRENKPSTEVTKEAILKEVELKTENLEKAESFGSRSIPQTSKSREAETVDAWWLYDDGGLNILIPYILTRRRNPRRALRIFAVSKFRIEGGRQKMESILKKYRINYDKLTMLTEAQADPSMASCDLFNAMIDHVSSSQNPLRAKTDKMLTMKTKRHIRIKELLMEHSSSAGLIVLTLPYPRKNVPSVLFLSWLEMLSVNLPPVLFVRGTRMPVLEA